MFHYVRPKDEQYPYLHHPTIEQFCKFLDIHQESLSKINPKEFIEYLKESRSFPQGAALLSFDDGLYDHYKWVFPELKKRGLSAFFFINTLPLISDDFLITHKVHIMTGKNGYPWFMHLFEQFANELGMDEDWMMPNPEALMAYPLDNADTALFKYSMNYTVPHELKDRIINRIFEDYEKGREKKERFYLNVSEVIEMSDGGMYFGYHGHSHLPFSRLSIDGFKAEMEISKKILTPLLKTTSETISYPFGDKSSITSDIINVLGEFGVKVGFISENEQSDNHLMYPRTDCATFLNYCK